jgi:serine/threonine protein phosphatase PrpC
MIGNLKAKKAFQMEDAISYKGNIGALADGHGKYGSMIANFACDRVIKELSILDSEVDPVQFFETMPILFRDIHHDFLKILGKNYAAEVVDDVPLYYKVALRGGTTLTVMYKGVFQNRDYIMTANVGDSDAFLFTVKDGIYISKKLTFTHEPTSELEYKRIQTQFSQHGTKFVYDTKGAQHIKDYLPIFDADGKKIEYVDTYKPYNDATILYQNAWQAWDLAKKSGQPEDELHETLKIVIRDYKLKKFEYESSLDSKRFQSTQRGDRSAYIIADIPDPMNKVMLAMTRSLGDYQSHKVGVIYEPFVNITDLSKEDLGDASAIFMASDGILDCYLEHELAKIVLNGNPNELIDIFQAKSLSLFKKIHDDMSFVTMRLK